MSCIPKYGNMMVFIVFHSQWWHNSPTNFRFLWVPPHRHTWARKAGGNGYVFAHNSHAHMSVVWSPDCEQQFHLSTHLQSTFARLPQGQTIHYGLCKYSGILTLVNLFGPAINLFLRRSSSSRNQLDRERRKTTERKTAVVKLNKWQRSNVRYEKHTDTLIKKCDEIWSSYTNYLWG